MRAAGFQALHRSHVFLHHPVSTLGIEGLEVRRLEVGVEIVSRIIDLVQEDVPRPVAVDADVEHPAPRFGQRVPCRRTRAWNRSWFPAAITNSTVTTYIGELHPVLTSVASTIGYDRIRDGTSLPCHRPIFSARIVED